MKLAECKTLAAVVATTVIVSTSALAAETIGTTGTYDASAALIAAAQVRQNVAGPIGMGTGEDAVKADYVMTESSDESLDAEMQSELYAEQLLLQHNAQLAAAAKAQAAAQAVTKVGDVVTEESTHYIKGAHVGNFKLTGYYGSGVTYSGVYPKANHTIAADLSILPMGTKVFINNTVYTVEDIGSAVRGNLIDVYYNTRAEAAGVTDRGWQFADVYIAVPV